MRVPKEHPARVSAAAVAVITMLASLLAFLPAPPAAAAPPPQTGAGALDTSFGTGGTATLTVAGLNLVQATKLLVQPNGSIVVAGVQPGSQGSAVVARFLPTGAPDTSFGAGAGYVKPGLGSSSMLGVVNLALQTDGKILVVGSGNASGNPGIAVARLNTDGSLDSTFGTGGIANVSIGGNPDNHGTSVAVDSSGRILATGTAHQNQGGSSSTWTVLRLTASGSPDTTFGTNGTGTVTTALGPNATPNDLVIDAGGHIVATGFANAGQGNTQNVIAVARYNSNGSLDTSFNSTGTLTVNASGSTVNSSASDVVLDSSGRIVVSGSIATSPSTGVVLRLTTAGALDTTFGTGGMLKGTFGDAGASNFGDAVDQYGRELVVGASSTGSSSTALGIQRLIGGSNPYDPVFGNPASPGRETISCPAGATGGGTAVGVQTDGRILVGGNCNGSLMVARLLGGAINNLKMSTSTASVPSGHTPIPLSSIQPALLTLDGTSLATAPTYSSATFGGGTFGGGTFGGGTYGGGTFGGGTFGGGTYGGGTYGGGTFGFIGTSPLVSPALPPIPLSEIPLASPASWTSVLAGTPYANLPPQSVTLQQVLGLNPVPQVTIDQFKIFNTALRKVTIASFLLSRTPFSSLPVPTGSTSWCAFFASQPANCSNTPGLQGNPTAYGPVDAELLGDNLASYYASTSVNLNGLALVDSVLPATPISLIALFDTPLGSVSTASLLAASSQTTYSSFVTCQPTTGSDHTCDTLGDAQKNGSVSPSSSASFGALLSAFSKALGPVTLNGTVTGLIPPQSLPIEKLPLNDITANSPLPATGAAHYAVDFDLLCGGAAGLAVNPQLPSGFRTVSAPGTATITVGSSTSPATVGPDGIIRPPSPVSCTGQTHVTVNFQAEPSSVLGPTTAGVTVTTNSDSASVTNQAPVQVVDNASDDSPSNPLPVASDNLYLGHLPAAGHIDYYGLAAPSPGSIVTVTLSHLPADYDLIVYGPPQPSLRAATFGGGTFGGGTFGGGTFGGGTFGGGTFGGGTFGGGTFGGGTYGGGAYSSPTVDGSVTPPELLKDVPVLSNQAVRSVSIQRGTTDEGVVFPVTESDTSPFLIQVSGYNGAASAQPYVLRVNVTPPAPALPCMSRNYNGGGTAGTLPTSISPDTQTLILVNQKRLGDIYGTSQVGTVMSQLQTLAARSEVQGVVIPVEGDSGVAGAYSAWDSTPCSVVAANNVVAKINALVDKLRSGLDHLKYMVVVGDDEVIPMGRVPDKTPAFNERGMADSLALGGKENAISSAFRNGYLLSDDPYGDLSPITTLEGQVFVPQLAVGRLVETPSDILNEISQYVNSNGVRNTSTGFVTGYDALANSATAVAATLNGRVPTTSLINSTWNRQSVVSALGQAYHGFVDLNAHSNPVAALPAQEFTSGTSSDPITTADLPADLSGSILLTIGCHVGTNVPDVFVGGGVPDWAQVTSHNGGLLQANTGYGLFDTNSVSFSDRILEFFAQNLDGSMSVGQALTFAKQKYLNMGVASPYDAKAMQEAVFYGLPMYVVNLNGKVGTTAPPVPIPSAPQPSTTPTLASGPVSFNTPLTKVNATSGGGSYYTVGNQFPEATPNEPIEPRTEIPLPARTDSLLPHGVLLESVSSQDIPGFTPVYANPAADSIPRPAGVSSAFFPSDLAAVGGIATPSGPQTDVVLTPGQFAAGGGGQGTQRNYTGIQGTVYYSNSTDRTPPNISGVTATIQSTTASILVTTPDTNIIRVVAQALVQGSTSVQTWQKIELANAGNGNWEGTLTVPSGTSQIQTISIQAVNSNGNVSTSYNKGQGFTAVVGAPPFTNTSPPTITIVTPKSGGTYAGAPGSPTIASSFTCASAVGIKSCTGPSTVDTSTAGSHTFSVVAIDNSGQTATASATYTVDNTAPSVTITTKPPATTNQTSATFAFSAADADNAATTLALACAVDGGVTYQCSSPQTLPNLPAGPHSFAVLAADPAGNVGSTSYSWRVDSTPPTVAFTSTPCTPSGSCVSNNKTPSFGFSVTDPDDSNGVVVSCQVDSNAATSPCSSPFTTPSLSDGSHKLVVTATDPAGNAGSATFSWSVDTSPPSVTLSGPSDPTPIVVPSSSSTASATFNFSVSDPNDSAAALTVMCSVDGGPPGSCQSPFTATGLKPQAAAHTFIVNATDPAGNSTTKMLSFHVLVSTTMTATPVVPGALGPQATLNETGGAAVVGEAISFYAGQNANPSTAALICTAQTNNTGTANCNSLGAAATAVAANGFTAVFAPPFGSDKYLGSSASAGVA